MTFLTTFSNITVDTQLTTGNLVANAVQANAENLKIAGGLNGQAIAAADNTGNLTFQTIPSFPRPQAPTANTQILFSNPLAPNNLGDSSGLTFNKVTNTMTVAANVATGNLVVSGNTVIANIGNVRIPGGSNGQALTTDGNGNLSWQTVSYGGVSSSVLTPDPRLVLTPGRGFIPAGAQTIEYTTTDPAAANLIQVGSVFALSNDPLAQFVCTFARSSPLAPPQVGYFVQNAFRPPMRLPAVTSPAGTTSILVSQSVQFGNLLASNTGTMIAKVNDGVLTLAGQPVPGANTQILYNNGRGAWAADANLSYNDSTNNLTVGGNVSTTRINTTGSVITSGGISTSGNLDVTVPSGSMTVVGNLGVSGSITAGNFSRGTKYAQYRQTNPQQSITPSTDTALTNWTDINPLTPTNPNNRLNTLNLFYDGVDKFYNPYNFNLNLLVSYSISWATETFTPFQNIWSIFSYLVRNGYPAQSRYAINSQRINSSSVSIQAGNAFFILEPGGWVQLRVWHNNNTALTSTSGPNGVWQSSTKLSFTAL